MMTSFDIDQVMNGFDFPKVQKHMQDTNRLWRGESPSIGQLESTAYQCLSTVVREQVVSCSTGGFLALLLTHSSGSQELKLVFSVESTFTTKAGS